MELNANVNTFYKGLNLDQDISIVPSDSIRYAENIKLTTNNEGTAAILQNAEYIQKYNITIPDSETIIGTVNAKYCREGKNDSPRECGIVFTKYGNGYNRVYLIDFDYEDFTEILNGKFNWDERLDLVSNFEQYDKTYVYLVDGINILRRINISKQYGEITDLTTLDMIPASELGKFECNGLTSGSLEAGVYQYAYQLFRENGAATPISSLSTVIPVVNTFGSSESKKVMGQQPNSPTGKGVLLETTFTNNEFEYFRVYRIFYETSGQLPQVSVIGEFKIDSNHEKQTVKYTDFGQPAINIITIDEFKQLVAPYDFIAQTIESQQNILFAANVKEETWDIDYDARAYRADKTGTVVLKSAAGNDLKFSFAIGIPNIPEEHDCINPSNLLLFEKDSFKYVYNKNDKLGGSGLNVSYEFIFKEIVLSSVDAEDTANHISLNATQVDKKNVKLYDVNGNTIETIDCPSHVPNYADNWICSNFTGYQRDEIYRFGIVFYNKRRIASPVHWIGDIKMPCSKNTTNSDGMLFPFNGGKHSDLYDKNVELNGYAMGIRFTVDNLPEEVIGYEIVRQLRDTSSRTIVTQGVLSSLYTPELSYGKNFIKNNLKGGDKMMWPQGLLSYAGEIRTVTNSGDGSSYMAYHAAKNYSEFVSAETCVSQENTKDLVKNKLVCQLYNLYTYNTLTSTQRIDYDNSGDSNFTKYHISFRPEKVMTWMGDEEENDPAVGVVHLSDGGNFLYMGMKNGDDQGDGSTQIYKYYNLDTLTAINSALIDNVISPSTIWDIVGLEDTNAYQMIIGEKAYTNVSLAGIWKWGWHGKNLILNTIDQIPFLPFSDLDNPRDKQRFNNIPVVNIKGTSSIMTDTSQSRNNTVYISCGQYNTADTENVNCFGGDTYLVTLDYLNTSFSTSKNDPEDEKERRYHSQCYIPLESTVNTNLFSNEQYHHNVNDGSMTGPNLIQHDVVVYGKHSQSEPQYVYNTIFSQDGTVVSFIHKGLYSEDDLTTTNRIIASQLKTNCELQDSWLVFKIANYLDVDNKYGQITNLKSFRDKLYYFQDNGVGIASVNERSLIIDNINELTLGKGGILARYDYATITNGNSIVRDYSIVTSTANLYWYDFNKNTICTIGQGIDELSKVKLVQSYLNDLWKENENRSRPVSTFDKKYDEIWFKIYDKTLVYNERLSVFTSFYTQEYNFALVLGDKFITILDNDFYRHNEQVKSNEPVEPLISKVHLIVNDNYQYTKVFDNVLFVADFEGNINNISNFLFKTKNQKSFEGDFNNIECREDTYRFPIPREEAEITEMSYLGRMRGKYLEEFYTFDCNDNKTFKIPFIKTTYRQSRL